MLTISGISAKPCKSRFVLFLRTVAIALATSAIGCNQTIAIVMTASIQEPAYRDLPSDEFSANLSVTASVLPIVLPWKITIYTPIVALGLSGIGYMPDLLFIALLQICHGVTCFAQDRRKARQAA